MTWFDWFVLLAIGVSTLLAFVRGVVRELIALVAWVGGFVAAVLFGPVLATFLPEMPGHSAARYLIAFAIIFIGALLVGALVAWPLSKAIRAAGLGFVDRFLGAIFGFARGIVFALALVLVAGLTPLPRSGWWHSSALVPPLVAGVFALKPHLPSELAGRLDYSPGGAGPKTVPGEQQA